VCQYAHRNGTCHSRARTVSELATWDQRGNVHSKVEITSRVLVQVKALRRYNWCKDYMVAKFRG
jgi:hypothetical protein